MTPKPHLEQRALLARIAEKAPQCVQGGSNMMFLGIPDMKRIPAGKSAWTRVAFDFDVSGQCIGSIIRAVLMFA